MFCEKCGKEMDAGSRFCQFCGAENLDTQVEKSDYKIPENLKLQSNSMSSGQVLNLNYKTIKRYFKIIGKIVLGIICLIIVWVSYFVYMDYLNRKQDKLVEITVNYDTSKCTKEYPLYVFVANNSKKTVNAISFYFKISRRGYSDDLTDYLSRRNESDKILNSKETYGSCWRYKLGTGYEKYNNPDNLVFSISDKYVYFAD